MSEVKRWTLKQTGATLLGSKTGEWVHYSACAALREQNQKLIEALEGVMRGTGFDDPCMDMNLPPWVNMARAALQKAKNGEQP